MKKLKSQIKSYEALYRFVVGIVLTCLIITIVGSAVHGTRSVEIVMRCLKVFFVVGGIFYLIVSTWVSWEEIRRSSK